MGINIPLVGNKNNQYFTLMGNEFPLMGNTAFFADIECHKKYNTIKLQ